MKKSKKQKQAKVSKPTEPQLEWQNQSEAKPSETQSKATVCISCEKEKPGRPINEDAVIRGIRWVKQKLGIARNNRLVVCADCTQKHIEKRQKFERSMLQYGVLGVILFLAIVALPPLLGGSFNFGSVIAGFFIIVFLLALSLVQYTPALAAEKSKKD